MLAHRPSRDAQYAHALMDLVRAGLCILSNLTFSHSPPPGGMPVCQVSNASLYTSPSSMQYQYNPQRKQKTPKTPPKYALYIQSPSLPHLISEYQHTSLQPYNSLLASCTLFSTQNPVSGFLNSFISECVRRCSTSCTSTSSFTAKI